MLKFALKRLIACVLVLIALSFLAFMVLNLTPGDSATTVLTHTFIGFDDQIFEEDVQLVSNIYKLDDPLLVQYWRWFKDAVRGDLGVSYVYKTSVWTMLMNKAPYTLALGLSAFVPAFLISVLTGTAYAKKRNGPGDHISRVASVFLGSIPGYWLGLTLIIIFAVKLNLLPIAGYQSPLSLIMPGLTLMLGMIPSTFRIMRSSMIDVLGQDYMTTAKLKGLGLNSAIRRHGLRNAMPPVITTAGLEVGHILGGSVIIEAVFSWPGIGNMLYNSIMAKDVPMMQGCIVLIGFGYVVSMFLVDIIIAIVDPRIRLEETAHDRTN
jgi:peptide/nickel transport system permease protein